MANLGQGTYETNKSCREKNVSSSRSQPPRAPLASLWPAHQIKSDGIGRKFVGGQNQGVRNYGPCLVDKKQIYWTGCFNAMFADCKINMLKDKYIALLAV